MGNSFSKVKTGSIFTTTDGEQFKKTSDLTFDDMAGLEHYIDPFFDRKIGTPVPAVAAPKAPKGNGLGFNEPPKVSEPQPEKPCKKAKKKAAKKSSKKK